MSVTTGDLLRMTQAELYALFSAHEPGPVPNGEEKGTAIVAPDTPFNAESAEAINLFAWQRAHMRNEAAVLSRLIANAMLSASA